MVVSTFNFKNMHFSNFIIFIYNFKFLEYIMNSWNVSFTQNISFIKILINYYMSKNK